VDHVLLTIGETKHDRKHLVSSRSTVGGGGWRAQESSKTFWGRFYLIEYHLCCEDARVLGLRYDDMTT